MAETAWSHLEVPECNGLDLSQQDIEMATGSAPDALQYGVDQSFHGDAGSTEPSAYGASSFEELYRMPSSEMTIPSVSAHRSNDLYQLSSKPSFSEDDYSSQRSSVGASGFADLNLFETRQDDIPNLDGRSIGEQDLESCMMDGRVAKAKPISIPGIGTRQDDYRRRPGWDDEVFQNKDSASHRSDNLLLNSLPAQPLTMGLEDDSDSCSINLVNPHASQVISGVYDRSLKMPRLTQDTAWVQRGAGPTARYSCDLSSTYPPTEGCWPAYHGSPASNEKSCRPSSVDSVSLRSRSTSLKLPSARKVSAGHNRVLTDRLRPPVPSKKLSIVYEQCEFANAQVVAVPDSHKAMRRGPLTPLQREQADKNRRERLVCIRCKRLKISCPGGIPCERCQKNSNAGPWGICTLFHFFSIVESGSLNYISQRTVNHPTLDGTRRVTLQLPEFLDLDHLLSSVITRSRSSNVFVRQAATLLYTLDLAKSSRFLSELRNRRTSGMIEVREFVDNLLPKTKGGLSCVSARLFPAELLPAQSCWNNMPSRVTYETVQKDSGAARVLNVEDPADQADILVAAQLARIVSRSLELEAFAHLQAQMGDLVLREPQANVDIESLVHGLGRVLLTLRWRMAWWKRFGDGSSVDIFRDRFVDRVESLLRILYFYYMYAFKKLPRGTDLRSYKGIRSVYADAKPLYEKLPHDESFEGFRAWLDQGEELIEQAGVAGFLSRCKA